MQVLLLMFLFAIKKWFFDFWDHLLIIVLCNVVLDLGIAAIVFLPSIGQGAMPYISLLLLIVGIFILVLLLAGLNGLIFSLTKHELPEISMIWDSFKRSWKPALVFASINVLLLFFGQFSMTYYGSMNNLLGFLLLGVIFWALLFWLSAMTWYFPIVAQLDTSVKKILKKSFILTFDNVGVTLLSVLFSIVIIGLSVLSMTLLPGLAGLMLWHHVVLKLRLYKYDWLELHPEAKAKDIPWDVLLKDEKEKVGKRTLKSIIFPWKY